MLPPDSRPDATPSVPATPLTEYEREGLDHRLTLADGHAYHHLDELLPNAMTDLAALWRKCETLPVPEAERSFRDAFASLAGTPAMRDLVDFSICPTASNSVEIAGAVLAEVGRTVYLIEPTFDNLALLLRRRRVELRPLPEPLLLDALASDSLSQALADVAGEALFLVATEQPDRADADGPAIRRGRQLLHAHSDDPGPRSHFPLLQTPAV